MKHKGIIFPALGILLLAFLYLALEKKRNFLHENNELSFKTGECIKNPSSALKYIINDLSSDGYSVMACDSAASPGSTVNCYGKKLLFTEAKGYRKIDCKASQNAMLPKDSEK